MMETLSAQELFEALNNNAKSSTVIEWDEDLTGVFVILKDQRINGKRAMKMAITDFHNLNIPYGVAMDVKSLIDTITENMSSKKKVAHSENILFEEKGTHEAVESFDDIRPFLSEKEFNSMSQYDKEVHQNMKRNYDQMVAKHPQLTHCIPQFMKPKVPKTNQDDSQRPSCSKAVSLTDSQRSSLRNKTPTTSDQPGPSSAQDMEPKRKRVLSIVHSNKPTKKKLSEKEYLALLPSFDIDDTLSKAKGKNVRELERALANSDIFTSKHSKLFIRTLVLQLFCGKDGTYNACTSSTQKEGLASSIVKRCPSFGDTTDKTKWSWWRVYDRKMNRGRIPNVISNLQRKVSDDKACSGIEPTSDEGEDDPNGASSSDTPKRSIDEFFWLSLLVPNAGENKHILTGMKDSFAARRDWIASSRPTIYDVLQKFPHLVSYDGELIEEEFKLLLPGLNHAAMLQTFPTFILKLKSVETLPSLPDNICDDVIQGCLWLADKMPWQNLRRFRGGRKEEVVLENLVKLIPAGVDVRTLIEETRAKSKRPVQPYLIALAPSASVTKMFAVADNKTVKIESSHLL